MATTRNAFDEAIQATLPELEKAAEETLADPAVQAALEDEDVDQAW
jgi:hypothetical protein